jgi:hypothetical protein
MMERRGAGFGVKSTGGKRDRRGYPPKREDKK